MIVPGRKKGAIMANRVMKSFRFNEDSIYDLRVIADDLGITETAALELCIDWAFKSGMVYGLENVRNRDGKINVRRLVDRATSGGEITNEVRTQMWQA